MESKFKVGDKVKCIMNAGEYTGAGWELGLVFSIEKVTHAGNGKDIYWPASRGCGVYEDSLELIESLSELKVGDKVRISIPRNAEGWEYDGAVGKIVAIREMENGVHLPLEIEFDKAINGQSMVRFTKDEVEKM